MIDRCAAQPLGTPRLRALAMVALIGFLTSATAYGKTLVVGPDQELKMPSAAAAVAQTGDTINIESGEYFDCAVWKADRLTIEGMSADVVITDKACQGKALFVVTGNDVTVRNLTLTRARVPDGNGAGIRAEGTNLRVEHSRFINNQNGILAGQAPKSTITVVDSEFAGNGTCEAACAHGIYVGQIALLHVERSKFTGTKAGHHIKSRALRTEVIASEIVDGEKGTASYLIEVPNGGSLIVNDSVLQKGPNASNHGAAIVIGAEGISQRTAELLISRNKFTNDQSYQTVFVRNMTATEAVLEKNSFNGQVIPLSGDGSVR
jgi:hypothetical protein